MNSNTNSKKIKKTCTCSTCGKSGHNASNKKFHPDYEFTGVSVPAPREKVICQQCERFMEDEYGENEWAKRTTKWYLKEYVTLCIHDGREDNEDQAGEMLSMCEDCIGATDQWGYVEQKDWLKNFGTEDPTAAIAAAKAMCYVDQRDSPNVLPYKRCYKCDGRSSCGNYVDDDWICEDCAPEEEEDDDGFEDCDVCGYIHHYEDKCPNETTCEHYERWKEEEEDNLDDQDIIIIKRILGLAPEPIPIVKIKPPIVEELEYMSELLECAVCLKQTKRMNLHWKEDGSSFTDVCEPCWKLDIVEYDGKKMKKCLTPCKTYPMMGRSWYKCLGYNSACSCAYEAKSK